MILIRGIYRVSRNPKLGGVWIEVRSTRLQVSLPESLPIGLVGDAPAAKTLFKKTIDEAGKKNTQQRENQRHESYEFHTRRADSLEVQSRRFSAV